jgi:hypothetical protein
MNLMSLNSTPLSGPVSKSLGPGNRLFAFISNRHGKYYASFAAVNGTDVLGVTINGPYKTERKAQKALERLQLYKLQMDADHPLVFLDTPTVPNDVRTYITEGLTAQIRRWAATDYDPDGINPVFGNALQ